MLTHNTLTDAHWWLSHAKKLAERVLLMMVFWALLGVLMGFGLGAHVGNGNRIAIFAHGIAGGIVLTGLGAILAFVGGRPVPSCVGAGVGTLFTPLLGGFASVSGTAPFSLAFLMGALTGATFWPWLQMLIQLGKYGKKLLVDTEGINQAS